MKTKSIWKWMLWKLGLMVKVIDEANYEGDLGRGICYLNCKIIKYHYEWR